MACVKPFGDEFARTFRKIFGFLKNSTQLLLTRRPGCSRVPSLLLSKSVDKDSKRGEKMERPNVVVIVADTFRRDHLGAYGNPYISTPHLDEFARSSVLFERHLLSSFPTMPARADML